MVIALFLLLGGAVLLVVLGLSVIRGRRRAEVTATGAPEQPCSVLHILRSEEELDDALRRAARFERGVAEAAGRRADRYEELIAPAPITEIRVGGRSLTQEATAEQARPA